MSRSDETDFWSVLQPPIAPGIHYNKQNALTSYQRTNDFLAKALEDSEEQAHNYRMLLLAIMTKYREIEIPDTIMRVLNENDVIRTMHNAETSSTKVWLNHNA